MGDSGFTIGVSGGSASYGAFHQEKPHISNAGSGTVIVKPLWRSPLTCPYTLAIGGRAAASLAGRL
jgi:hypothetical protein